MAYKTYMVGFLKFNVYSVRVRKLEECEVPLSILQVFDPSINKLSILRHLLPNFVTAMDGHTELNGVVIQRVYFARVAYHVKPNE